MNIKFDKEADAVYVRFSDAKIADTRHEKPGVVIDYDADGNVVGIELLNASQRIDQPGSVIYEFQ